MWVILRLNLDYVKETDKTTLEILEYYSHDYLHVVASKSTQRLEYFYTIKCILWYSIPRENSTNDIRLYYYEFIYDDTIYKDDKILDVKGFDILNSVTTLQSIFDSKEYKQFIRERKLKRLCGN